MKKSKQEPQPKNHHARTAPIVRSATLLSPQEGPQTVGPFVTNLACEVQGHWSLGAAASEGMFADLKSGAPARPLARMTAFQTVAGASYAMFVVDSLSGFQQHRCLLPLFVDKVLAFLDALSCAPLHFGFSNVKDGNHRLQYAWDIHPDQVDEVLDASRAMDRRDTLRFIAEVPSLLLSVRSPELLRSHVAPASIREVEASMLMPQREFSGRLYQHALASL
jgi:hypothetical protein